MREGKACRRCGSWMGLCAERFGEEGAGAGESRADRSDLASADPGGIRVRMLLEIDEHERVAIVRWQAADQPVQLAVGFVAEERGEGIRARIGIGAVVWRKQCI